MKTVAITPSSQNLPHGLSRWDWVEVVASAARKWSYPTVQCTSAQLVVGSLRDWRTVGDDDVNLVVFREHVWCKNERCGREGQFSSRAMAMTQTYPDGARGDRIRGADIELNSVNFLFQQSEPPTDQATSLSTSDKPIVKLEAVVLHELGHVLGLEDKCAAAFGKYPGATCSSDDTNSVMFAPAQHLELAASDVAALCALYPRETPSLVNVWPELDSATSEVALLFGGIAVVAVLGAVITRRHPRRS